MHLTSLRLRLTLFFILLTALTWCCASLIAWHYTTKELNKLFDTQQMLFAKRLSVMSFDETASPPALAPTKKMLRHHRGKQDDDAMAFAIFDIHGKMRLNDGDNGRDIPWHYYRDGFIDGYLPDDDDEWRFLWLTSSDGRFRIVVAQEWEYREDMAIDIVTSQLYPWLVALPGMILILMLLLHRELRPLGRLSRQLATRLPDSPESLDTAQIPGEVRPLVSALNQLFARTHHTIERERRFISDAAHEIRSPLAGLKVQAEVVQLAGDDKIVREQALTQMQAGITRTTRLVEQLLTLSRLDALDNPEDSVPVSLNALLQDAVADIYPCASARQIEIQLHLTQRQICLRGQALLLSLPVRNLLDNAVRYCSPGCTVELTLDDHSLTVADNGPGMSDDTLARVGERFWRPPGQKQTGSGLGLSIVKRIAALHRMTVALQHAPGGGFQATIRFPSTKR